MSEYEGYCEEDEHYANFLPKKFTKIRQKASQPNEKSGKLEQMKTQQKTEYSTSSMYIPQQQQSEHTLASQENNNKLVNVSHLFVRQYHKSNPNTPFRKRSADCAERLFSTTQSHFDYSPYKLIKQSKQDTNFDNTQQRRSSLHVCRPIKNIQNISFDTQFQMQKTKQTYLTQQEYDGDGQSTLSLSNIQNSPTKKRQIFKSVFGQTTKNQQDILKEERKRVEGLQSGLVIKNIKPREIFTNATLVKTQQSLAHKVQNTHSKQNTNTTTPQRQRIIKNTHQTRPSSSSSISKKKLLSSEMQSNEKLIISYLSGQSMSNSFIVTGTRNQTPSKDIMRNSNLSFYSGDQKDQKMLFETSKHFRSMTRPKTAEVSRSPSKAQQLQTTQGQMQTQNAKILCKRLSSTNQSTQYIELDQDTSFQVLGKSSQIFSSPKNQRLDSQKFDNFSVMQQDQGNEIEQKVKEGLISPTVNNTTIFNNRNVLKKHHFVKNVADISLFEKNKRVQMNQFVFESPSPSRKVAIRQNLSNNFFSSMNCVEIFNL